MTDRIFIEGDRIRHVREEIVSEAPLDSIRPFLTTRLATTFPILPQRPARYVYNDPDAGHGMMIVETQPSQHTIIVRHGSGRYAEDAARRDADGLSRFRVILPYQYFTYTYRFNGRTDRLTDFTVDHSFLFWAPQPFRQPTDKIWPARCPNVSTDGSICWGSTTSDSTSLSARIDDLVNNFFVTQFNEDLGHYTPFDTSLLRWEENSANPLAFREWEMFDPARGIEVQNVWSHIGAAQPVNIAELNPAHVDLPVLPQNFTIGRAQEWLNELQPGASRRIAAAIARNGIEADTEEATA